MSLQSDLCFLTIAVSLCIGITACGTKSESVFGTGTPDAGVVSTGDASADGTAPPYTGGVIFLGFDASVASTGDGSTTAGYLTVNQSSPQTVTVTVGQPLPQITFVATYNGASITPSWFVDQGSLASINANGVFTPTGTAAGTVNVIGIYQSQSIVLAVNIVIVGSQNGPLAGQQLPTFGSGGFGGVGGEGVGPAIQDTGVVNALNGTPTGTAAAKSLVLLYPYDATVWPQGLLAPLLQWSSSLTSVTGIKITLASSTNNYSWSGTFAPPPAIYADGGVGNFIRHPILQDVWAAATNSTGGTNTLTMTLTVATGSGATAASYGPVSQTWTIAPAALTGTIYYNSYGTGLVQNSGAEGNAAVTNQPFGAAVLSIASGATAPVVAAGYSSSNDNACRVCHVVAGGGSALIVQEGDSYYSTWAYTPGVTAADAGTLLHGASSTSDGTFAWAGLSYDGTLALSNVANMAANASYTKLYSFPPPTGGVAVSLDAGGLPPTFRAGLPVFSSDTTKVAFTLLNSSSTAQLPGLTCTNDCLAAMSFNRATNTFSNPVKLFDVANHVGFASFMPTNDSVLFQRQLGGGGEYLGTWQNGTSQIYWVDLATQTAAVLNNLNGIGANNIAYIPSNTQNGHASGNDVNLNYEPTVNPIATGGYAWVIFTTRRIYGNIATQNAWLSDPRTSGYNYLSPNQITTKKLWVAAIDLNAPAGSDPSHPAFYLPAQEIQAGNSRGYWVLSPCSGNGVTCTTGSQCCDGYCSATPGTGALVCAGPPSTPTCSTVGNPCTTGGNCCDDTNLCINGFCSVASPR